MRFRSRILAFFALASLGIASVGYGVAQAQSAAPPAAPGPGDTSAGLQRPVNLSPEEMSKQGDLAVARIEMGAGVVRRMLEKARSERDVVKTLCLNDKLSQLDVTLRSAKERRSALEAAANRKDTELSNHEFTILGVYRQRGDRLTAEANQCVGSEVGFIGDTRLTTSIDPTIPDDQGGPPGVPITPIVITPPICASCAI
jgi:hypothetical protein